VGAWPASCLCSKLVPGNRSRTSAGYRWPDTERIGPQRTLLPAVTGNRLRYGSRNRTSAGYRVTPNLASVEGRCSGRWREEGRVDRTNPPAHPPTRPPTYPHPHTHTHTPTPTHTHTRVVAGRGVGGPRGAMGVQVFSRLLSTSPWPPQHKSSTSPPPQHKSLVLRSLERERDFIMGERRFRCPVCRFADSPRVGDGSQVCYSRTVSGCM